MSLWVLERLQQAPVTFGRLKPHKSARPDVVLRAVKQKGFKLKAPSGKQALQTKKGGQTSGDVLQDAALASAKPGSQQGVGQWQKALRRVG